MIASNFFRCAIKKQLARWLGSWRQMVFSRYENLMKSTFRYLTLHLFVLAVYVSTLAVLTGCGEDSVPVNIHGVNYTSQEFSFTIVDPVGKKNLAGGELIGPFAAGGTMCCYTLPAKWRAGIKVQIDGTHWLPEKPDGSLPEVKETKVVEVPPYVNGKPAELWVLRGADGDLSVISSDFQPDHAKWPGKVKGWPVPSLEYQRERWDLFIKNEQMYVDLFERLSNKMRDSPAVHAAESWQYAKTDSPELLSGFSGPQDTKYHAELIKEYAASMKVAKDRLAKLQEHRP
jgi:hypothetical protein